jgi:uncharacterized protein YjbI with pentapeptide repeats
MCSIKYCKLDKFNDSDKCILHCEKDDWYNESNGKRNWEKSKKNINSFWSEIHKSLDENYTQEYGYKTIDKYFFPFDDIIFPEFQKDYLPSTDEFIPNPLTEEVSNFYFKQEVYNYNGSKYHDATCKDIENISVTFKNCTFLGKANFLKYSFEKMVIFDNCTFEKEVLLNDKFINRLVFKNKCDFNKCTLDLSYKTFNSQINITDCINIGELKCINTNFNIITFKNSEITNSSFANATFNEKSSFKETTFENKTDFSYTTFNKICSFRKSVFTKELDLTDTVLNDNVNFLDIEINELNRETARIIKNSFEKQNNIIAANEFYALEMKERERELNFLNNPFEWLVFKFHKISSDHSQDWLLSLFWIINIAFLFGYINLENILIIHKLDKTFLLLMLGIPISYLSIKYRAVASIPITIFIYYLYSKSELIVDSNLDCFAKNLNPFSLMNGNDPITFGTLIFKIVIAYLLYQLIISIRQNTRRK